MRGVVQRAIVLMVVLGGLVTGLLASAAPKTITDGVGRTVQVPANLDGGIVTIGSSGPLRFLSIFDVFDKVIQVDKGDVTDQKNGRAYSYAYPYDTLTPQQYHPDNKLESETVERIGAKKPSLILVQESVYKNYKENCDLLASAFTLVVLPAQSMTHLWNEDYRLADWYVQKVRMIGALLGQEARAQEHLAGVNGILADIRSLVTQSDKRVYVAGLTWQGSNELTTTFPTYLPLMLSGGINAHGGSELSRVILDPEAVTTLGMDYVVIDPSSSDKLSTPNSQLILAWLYKRQAEGNVRLFATLPMVWDSANYDCVLGGAYYLVHLLYGTLSAEVVEEKIQRVFEVYYGARGATVLSDMKTFFEGKSAANGVELPPLGELLVVQTAAGFGLEAK